MSRIIIAVDVGNGFVKTVNSEPFVSSIRDFGETKPAILDRTVKYGGCFYTVGGERSRTKTDNKVDNTDFILTLAAIGEELKMRGIRETTSHIILSEGLPVERCTESNQNVDKEYYKRGETIEFEYEGVKRVVVMDEVFVNPQAVSGIAELISAKKIPKRCLVADIGSWTMDTFMIDNWRAQGATTHSFLSGIINCLNACNDEIRRRTGKEVLESQIQEVMRGEEMVLPPKYTAIIEEQIEKYVRGIADLLNENKYNTDTLYIVFMGGGAELIERYGKKYFPMSMFLTDIRANAVGYEQIARLKARKMGLI